MKRQKIIRMKQKKEITSARKTGRRRRKSIDIFRRRIRKMEEKKIDRKRLREIETRKQRRKKEEKKKKKERVKCIMKRRRTRLDVGRKDDKEEATTKVFDTMIRNTSPENSGGRSGSNVPLGIPDASQLDIVPEFGPDEEIVRL
ncbi:hypothetical protein Tco_0863940 [Tanacetum coccineum]